MILMNVERVITVVVNKHENIHGDIVITNEWRGWINIRVIMTKFCPTDRRNYIHVITDVSYYISSSIYMCMNVLTSSV